MPARHRSPTGHQGWARRVELGPRGYKALTISHPPHNGCSEPVKEEIRHTGPFGFVKRVTICP